MRNWMLAIGSLVAFCVGLALFVDEGEVVVLRTADVIGKHDTQVWVIDGDALASVESADASLAGSAQESLYLRARSPKATWLARLRVQPEVELIREDAGKARYVARILDDRAILDELNRLLAAKYGFADRLWGMVRDPRGSVAVRLEPSDYSPERIRAKSPN